MLGVPEVRIDSVEPIGLGDRQPGVTPAGYVQAVPGVPGNGEALGVGCIADVDRHDHFVGAARRSGCR